MRLPGVRPRVVVPIAVTALVVAAGTAPPAAAEVREWGGAVATVGRILWEEGDGRLGMCSAAVVDAPNGSVVATAAHCVRSPEEPEPPAEAWFVPAYDHDARTYQRDGWLVTGHHTPRAWDVTRGTTEILPHDYAFLTVETKDGRTLEQEHGANRPAFEPVPEGEDVTALGYPAADPFDGESLHSCAGQTRVLDEEEAQEPNVGGLLLEDCDMTAGSSGGPWLADFDEARGSGTLLAVTSVGSGEGHIIGRPFPEAARDLLATAGGG
ncbi:trypsin-like serine peptidase [Streptomyces sp. 4N509B]|uniref:trypsin-like serine peptidase n=1 Tax=Streptomyces sp. 4N509B TaxID=3457413 RepID=UPI003FD668E7